MICFVSFELKVGSCRGCVNGEKVLPREAGLSYLSYSQLLFEATARDVRCDAGRVFDYTSYFVTVG